jgi:hypothetical protein
MPTRHSSRTSPTAVFTRKPILAGLIKRVRTRRMSPSETADLDPNSDFERHTAQTNRHFATSPHDALELLRLT